MQCLMHRHGHRGHCLALTGSDYNKMAHESVLKCTTMALAARAVAMTKVKDCECAHVIDNMSMSSPATTSSRRSSCPHGSGQCAKE